jgi:hypothetical protein
MLLLIIESKYSSNKTNNRRSKSIVFFNLYVYLCIPDNNQRNLASWIPKPSMIDYDFMIVRYIRSIRCDVYSTSSCTHSITRKEIYKLKVNHWSAYVYKLQMCYES